VLAFTRSYHLHPNEDLDWRGLVRRARRGGKIAKSAIIGPTAARCADGLVTEPKPGMCVSNIGFLYPSCPGAGSGGSGHLKIMYELRSVTAVVKAW
jgi:hypothetical protein